MSLSIFVPEQGIAENGADYDSALLVRLRP